MDSCIGLKSSIMQRPLTSPPIILKLDELEHAKNVPLMWVQLAAVSAYGPSVEISTLTILEVSSLVSKHVA